MSGIHMAAMASAGETVSFVIDAVGATSVFPAAATGSVALQSNGTMSYVGLGSSGSANWVQPSPPAGAYWVRLTINSGTPNTGGTAGTWLALTSGRTWSWQTTGTAIANCTIAVAADAAGTVILASSTFDVDVESV